MKGFTLFEMMIVIAIIAIIAAATAPTALRFFATQNQDDVTLSIVGTLRQARAQSVAQKNDSAFGVKFSAHAYTFFQGSSYATRTTTYDITTTLPNSLTISGISEMVFAKLTGLPSSVGTIVITGPQMRSIQINSQGIIEPL